MHFLGLQTIFYLKDVVKNLYDVSGITTDDAAKTSGLRNGNINSSALDSTIGEDADVIIDDDFDA